MRVRAQGLLVAMALLGVALPTFGQTANPLVGTWERFSLRNADGGMGQPPAAPAFLIMSAEGYFSQTGIPAGRKKVDKPLDELTREELLDRFRNVSALRGKYTVSGNKLTRSFDSNVNTNQEGIQLVQEFRIEGDVLILTSTTPGSQAEARFRRVK